MFNVLILYLQLIKVNNSVLLLNRYSMALVLHLSIRISITGILISIVYIVVELFIYT